MPTAQGSGVHSFSSRAGGIPQHWPPRQGEAHLDHSDDPAELTTRMVRIHQGGAGDIRPAQGEADTLAEKEIQSFWLCLAFSCLCLILPIVET
jgi:hypothetical protein